MKEKDILAFAHSYLKYSYPFKLSTYSDTFRLTNASPEFCQVILKVLGILVKNPACYKKKHADIYIFF